MEMSTLQAAAPLGLTEQVVRDHVSAGRLSARRHGIRGAYKFREEDLRSFATKYRYLIDEEVLPQPRREGSRQN